MAGSFGLGRGKAEHVDLSSVGKSMSDADMAHETAGPGPEGSVEPAPAPAAGRRVRRRSKSIFETDAISLPIEMHIVYYRGVTKTAKVEELVRSWIEKNFTAPNASWYYLQEDSDGIIAEIQMGGGQAFLPEITSMLEKNPNEVVYVPLSGRLLQVSVNSEHKNIEPVLLSEGQEPPAGARIALPSLRMIPYDKRGGNLLAVGVTAAVIGACALLYSLGGLLINTQLWARPYVEMTKPSLLPSAQIDQINLALRRGDCLAKMEFVGGSWSFSPGVNQNGACAAKSMMASSASVGSSLKASVEAEASVSASAVPIPAIGIAPGGAGTIPTAPLPGTMVGLQTPPSGAPAMGVMAKPSVAGSNAGSPVVPGAR